MNRMHFPTHKLREYQDSESVWEEDSEQVGSGDGTDDDNEFEEDEEDEEDDGDGDGDGDDVYD
jgi:hypothetical protein